MALPKQHRLKRRQDFSAVYQKGLRRSSTHLILRALWLKPEIEQAKSSQPIQVGVSISQKVSKRAVVRNRIKRHIRAAVQKMLPLLGDNWRIVIVVKPNATQCGCEQILQELEQLFINAEVMDGY